MTANENASSLLEILLVVLVLVAFLAISSWALWAARQRALRGRQPRTEVTSAPTAPPQEPDVIEPPITELPSDETTELVPDDLEPLAEPAIESPEPPLGRLARLRSRLARSQSSLGRGLLALLGGGDLTDDQWEELEDTLLAADVGVGPTTELVENLRTRLRVAGSTTAEEARAILREELIAMVQVEHSRDVNLDSGQDTPGVVLMVGVNGTGKTTTVGRLARILVAEDQRVLLAAADTFRAAAADQLQTWGERVGADTVRGPEGGDPASVAFEAVKRGIDENVDAVLVDTAGRLHTKSGLMDELGKVKRVIEKQAPVTEVLLVIDATTGQNGLTQARVFAEVTDVTGIVLTKLDGTAKGGIVVAVQRELGVPVKFVGLGEGPDDLAPFDPVEFVDALLA